MQNIVYKRPLDGALAMLSKGFKVFPLGPNSKLPVAKGWQQWAETATEQKVVDYGTANPLSNWGVYCGPSNLFVVDVDNKQGKQGTLHLKELQSENSNLPKTLTVQTPTGGLHIYYEGSGKSTTSAITQDVDVKSTGGYVVAPGSVIDGKSYELKFNEPVVPVPAWILELNNKRRDPINIDTVTTLPEGNRDETLTRLGGGMRRFGLSFDAIFAALLAENDRICTPPLEREQVEKIARSVARYAPEEAKALQAFGAVPEGESGPIEEADFTGTPAPRVWLIKDWIPLNEISSMYGSGGSGKSLLSLQLGLAVSTGTPFMSLPVEKQVPTLIVFCEDSKEEIHRRLYAIKNAPEFTFLEAAKKVPLFLWPRVGLNNDIARISDNNTDVVPGPFRQILTDQLDKMNKGPKLLILDTLSDVYLGDENVREKVTKFIKTHLGSMITKYELTILLLAHPSRAGKSTKDYLSGSTAWENAVRNRLAFFPHKDFAEIMVLKRMKSNYAKRGEELFLTWEAGRFKTVNVAQAVKDSMTDEGIATLNAISDLIPMAGEKMILNTLCRELKDHPLTSAVFSNSHMTTIGRGLQRLLDTPRHVNGLVYSILKSSCGALDGRARTWVIASKNKQESTDRIDPDEEIENALL